MILKLVVFLSAMVVELTLKFSNVVLAVWLSKVEFFSRVVRVLSKEDVMPPAISS